MNKKILKVKIKNSKDKFCPIMRIYKVYRRILCSNLFFILFHLYVYSFDLQHTDGGAIHWASNYLYLLSEMTKYCCSDKI